MSLTHLTVDTNPNEIPAALPSSRSSKSQDKKAVPGYIRIQELENSSHNKSLASNQNVKVSFSSESL